MSKARQKDELDRTRPPKMQWTGMGVSLGAGVGVIFGLLLAGGAGIAIGAGVGAGIGVAIGAAFDAMAPRS